MFFCNLQIPEFMLQGKNIMKLSRHATAENKILERGHKDLMWACSHIRIEIYKILE